MIVFMLEASGQICILGSSTLWPSLPLLKVWICKSWEPSDKLLFSLQFLTRARMRPVVIDQMPAMQMWRWLQCILPIIKLLRPLELHSFLQTPTRHHTDTFLKPPDTFQTRQASRHPPTPSRHAPNNLQTTPKTPATIILVIFDHKFWFVFGQNLVSVQKREVQGGTRRG